MTEEFACFVERNGATEAAKGAEKRAGDDDGPLQERNRGRHSAFALVTNSLVAFVCSVPQRHGEFFEPTKTRFENFALQTDVFLLGSLRFRLFRRIVSRFLFILAAERSQCVECAAERFAKRKRSGMYGEIDGSVQICRRFCPQRRFCAGLRFSAICSLRSELICCRIWRR